MRRVGLVVLLVVVLGMVAVVLRGRCDEDEDLVEFPYTIEIAPGNYLFVDGHEFHGEVVCTWEDGDSVRIEGIPVLPSRPSPIKGKPKLTEADFQQRYGDVPFVVARVQEGATWREAQGEFWHEVEVLAEDAERTYWKALESTGSEELAVQAVLDSLDRTLLDPSIDLRVFPSGMSLTLDGRASPIGVPFGNKPPWEMPTLEELQRVTPKKARGLARSVARTMKEYTGTWMVVISSQVGEMTLAGRAVSKALKQIEEGEKGRLTTGPLPERELNLILSVRGVKIDETDE